MSADPPAPFDTVADLIRALQEFDPVRPVRLAVNGREVHAARLLTSDEPWEVGGVYLAPDNRTEPLPWQIQDQIH